MTKKFRWARLVLVLIVLAAAVAGVAWAWQQLEKQMYPVKYNEYVQASAQEYGLDPYLILAFIRTESGFNAMAVSDVGARGLMQITEETYAWIHSKIDSSVPPDFAEMYDPQTNIRYGSYYIACCLARYHSDIATAAAAYHSGWGTVDGLLQQSQYSLDGNTLDEFPYKQMSRYVVKIDGNYQKYLALYQG